MKWVISNERRPDKDGFYFAKDSHGSKVMVFFQGGHWIVCSGYFPIKEWLDESTPTPSHGRTAEEIHCIAGCKHFTGGEVKHHKDCPFYPDSLSRIYDELQAMHDFTNQAMEEHRTQPQEGREEVECTHPYKECVMSDRVNKNGTPLTKCSVCGNDNICDEELMDESVNTFTKEDMLAAFCAAEGYVDFDKWLEQYKPYQHTW